MEGPIAFSGSKEQESNIILPDNYDDDDDDLINGTIFGKKVLNIKCVF
jgi:hypothetical protein